LNGSNDIIYEKHFDKVMDKGVLVPFYDKLTTIPYRQINPVINCNTYCIFHICHELQSNSVYFIAITSTDISPLFVSTFLLRVKVTLRYSYVDGNYNDIVLKSDSIRLAEIMDQMCDGGFPFVTEPNTIEQLMNDVSVTQKLEKVVLGDYNVNYDKNAYSSRTLPWRKDQVVHKNNEILFDVNERLSTVFNLVTGKSSRTEVIGEVVCLSSLSGVPDVTLRFENPQIMDDVSFHPCIRIGKWEQQRILSFVPPEGRFTLFNYRVRGSLQAPIKVGGSVKYTEDKAMIELSVYANNVPGLLTQGQLKGEVINISMVIQFPVSVTSVNLVSNTGSFDFKSDSHVLTWNIGRNNPKIIPTISGVANRSLYESGDIFTMVSLHFEIINHAASGIRFKHLD